MMNGFQTSADLERTASRRPEEAVTGKSAACSKVHPHIHVLCAGFAGVWYLCAVCGIRISAAAFVFLFESLHPRHMKV